MITTESAQFVNVRRAAEILGLSASHLNKLRLYAPDKSPPFARIGKRVVYPLHGPLGLGAWADRHMQGGAA